MCKEVVIWATRFSLTKQKQQSLQFLPGLQCFTNSYILFIFNNITEWDNNLNCVGLIVTLFLTSNPHEWKQAHKQECGLLSPGPRWSLLTDTSVLVGTISITVHLSWILILHETISWLWLQMKGSVGLQWKNVRFVWRLFHALVIWYICTLNVLIWISRPCQMFYPVDVVVCFLFSLCNGICVIDSTITSKCVEQQATNLWRKITTTFLQCSE